MKIKLQHVHYMPKTLEFGVLYVSKEFKTASHLCACGCGLRVNTPLKPTEWTLQEASDGVSLYPSIGNWQQPCKSHYWINKGEVKWSNQWTAEQISMGRMYEEKRRVDYFERQEASKENIFKSFMCWIKKLFRP